MDYVTEQLARYSLLMGPQDEEGEGSRRTTEYSSKAARSSYVSNEKLKLSVVDKIAITKVGTSNYAFCLSYNHDDNILVISYNINILQLC